MKNYTITRRTDGAQFDIEKTENGARVYSRHMWSRGPACVFVNGLILPEELPTFSSFIKAVAYCKKNLANLY